MATLTTVRVDQIVIPGHQDPARSRRGDIIALADDIAKNGMHMPILITKDYTLLDGARRLALYEGKEKVSAYEVTSTQDLYDLLEKAKHPLQAPWDPRRVFDLHIASEGLRRAERALNAQTAKKKHQAGVPAKGRKYSSFAQNPTRYAQAKTSGMGMHQLQATMYLYSRYLGFVPYKPENKDLLEKAIGDLEAGATSFSAYHHMRKAEREREIAEADNRVQTAPEQRRLLAESISSLRGVSRGLGMLTDINSKITADEAAAWKQELFTLKANINRTINKLRERMANN